MEVRFQWIRHYKKNSSSIKVYKSLGVTITAEQYTTLTAKSYRECLDNHNLNFPLFVKPLLEGSSLGITMVKTIDELMQAVTKAATIDERRIQNVVNDNCKVF